MAAFYDEGDLMSIYDVNATVYDPDGDTILSLRGDASVPNTLHVWFDLLGGLRCYGDQGHLTNTNNPNFVPSGNDKFNEVWRRLFKAEMAAMLTWSPTPSRPGVIGLSSVCLLPTRVSALLFPPLRPILLKRKPEEYCLVEINDFS